MLLVPHSNETELLPWTLRRQSKEEATLTTLYPVGGSILQRSGFVTYGNCHASFTGFIVSFISSVRRIGPSKSSEAVSANENCE